MRKIILLAATVVLLITIAIITGCPSGDEGNGNGYTPPLPASFSLSNLSIEPLEALPGETVTITATLSNTGGTSGSHDVTINIDGVEGDTQTITVSPGGNQSVVFEVYRDDSASYEVVVGNLSGSFTVMSTEMILQSAFEAMTEVSTLQFDVETVSTYTDTDDSETSTSTEIIYGAVDITGNQAYQTRTEDIDNGSQIRTLEIYISNGWMYSKLELPPEPGDWQRDQVSESTWLHQINTLFILDFIELLPYELINLETIDGIECLKLEFGPQPIEQGVEAYVSVWVATDTRYIIQIFMDIDEDYGTYTSTDTITIIWHHYNEPVTVEVPLEATVVNIPDPNLEAAIRENLNKPHSPIYMADMETITNLYAQDRGILDISGLEYCTNLQELDLIHNSIVNISPLTDLTNLQRLTLADNDIVDITPLADLTDLEFLYLAGNNFSDISPLSGLTKLEYLLIHNNYVSDISPLASLTNLQGLESSVNNISDVSPLAGLINLQLLELGWNNISNLTPLVNLINLHDLFLGDNNISDISPLEGLISLKQLWLHSNNISDITPLSGLINLEKLFIGSYISDISPLAGLINLTSLNLEGNNISDLSPLTGLTNLWHINLAKNDISDISVLANLPNLGSLYFLDNNISDLSPLAGLSNLTFLNFVVNNIRDISPLVENSGIAAGDNVYLLGNPLNNTSRNVYIPQLEARGVTVHR